MLESSLNAGQSALGVTYSRLETGKRSRRTVVRLADKISQVGSCVQDHLDGRFTIPGDLAGGYDAYLPVVVVDEPFVWSGELRDVVDKRVAAWPTDVRVAKPIVIDVATFENLIHAVESGHHLADLLRALLMADRETDPRRVITARTGDLSAPKLVGEGLLALGELARAELFDSS